MSSLRCPKSLMLKSSLVSLSSSPTLAAVRTANSVIDSIGHGPLMPFSTSVLTPLACTNIGACARALGIKRPSACPASLITASSPTLHHKAAGQAEGSAVPSLKATAALWTIREHGPTADAATGAETGLVSASPRIAKERAICRGRVATGKVAALSRQ